jgi:hypothetical protein
MIVTVAWKNPSQAKIYIKHMCQAQEAGVCDLRDVFKIYSAFLSK